MLENSSLRRAESAAVTGYQTESIQVANPLAGKPEIFKVSSAMPVEKAVSKVALVQPFGAKVGCGRPEFDYLVGSRTSALEMYCFNSNFLAGFSQGADSELVRQKATIKNLAGMEKELEHFLTSVAGNGPFGVLTNSNACGYVAQSLVERKSEVSAIAMLSPLFSFNQDFLNSRHPVTDIAREFERYAKQTWLNAANNLRKCNKPLLVVLADNDELIDLPLTRKILDEVRQDVPLAVVSMPHGHFINRLATNPNISQMYQLIADFFEDPETFVASPHRFVELTPFSLI